MKKLFIFLLISLLFFCCRNKESKPIIEEHNGVKIIDNPEFPEYSNRNVLRLVFKKELTIPLEGTRYSINVDEKGNIYAFDLQEGRIEVYDKKGKLVRKFGRKGQGPGEFLNPIFLSISPQNNLFTFDLQLRRIQVFDRQGNLLNIQDFPPLIGIPKSFKFDSKINLYIHHAKSVGKTGEKEKLKQGVVFIDYLSKFNSNFEKLSDIYKFNNEFWKKSSEGKTFFLVHPNIFYYQIDKNDNLYLGHSSKYEILVYFWTGKLKKIIKKKARPIRVTNRDIKKLMEKFPEIRKYKANLKFAKYKPFFSSFYILEGIGLLVCTYENEWNEKGTITCDLFDEEGIYVAKVEIPGYYACYHHGYVMEQINRVFKKNYCYSIVYNEEKNSLELVKHKVILVSQDKSKRI
jgi:hypothetical protein